MAASKPIKIVTVGDSAVGKTCLLKAFSNTQPLPTTHKQTIFDIYECNIVVDRLEYTLSLYDTAGHENYELLTPLNFPDTDCFILCYSAIDRESFANIKLKWLPLISQYLKQSSVILVCTKIDLKSDLNHGISVSKTKGLVLQKDIGAEAMIECSAFANWNICKIFEDSIRAINLKKNNVARRGSSFRLLNNFFCGSKSLLTSERNMETNDNKE